MVTERTVLVRLRGDASNLNRALVGAKAAVRGVREEIDTTNDRTTWLAQSVLALGPTFPALAAAAVPALAGIASQLTVAATAGGVMALAFNGIGDALDAVNKYQLDPTAENFEKLQQAIEKVGPAGAQFVAFLDSVGPKFAELQMLARAGMFPGITEGIEEAMQALPVLRRIVTEIAEGIGQLASEAGGGIAGGPLAEFFEWLETNGKGLLVDLGRTIGNFAAGFADMLVAFDPLTQDFSDGLLQMSRDFAAWSDGLNESAGFRDFVSYVREAVPIVMDFLGSLVDAFVQIVQAAAPVGEVLLPVLSRFLDVIGAIADTPLGPIILGLTAIASLYGRLAAIGTLASGGIFSPITKSLKSSAADTRAAAGSINKDVSSIGAVWATAGARTAREQERMSAATKSLRGNIGSLAGSASRIAGPIAGLGLATSGLADNMGLSNTATLGLLGTMAGPWGAAAGAVVGAFLDVKGASDDSSDSIEQWRETLEHALSAGDFRGGQTILSQAREQFAAFKDDVTSENFGEWLANGFDPDAIANNIEDLWSDLGLGDGKNNVEEQQEALRSLQAEYANTEGSARGLAEAMGIDITGSSVEQMNALQEVMRAAQPTMDSLGYSWEQLSAAFAVQEGGGNIAQQMAIGMGVADDFTQMLANIVAGADEGGAAADRMAGEIAAAFEKGTTAAERFEAAIESANAALDQRASLANYEAALDDARATLKDVTKDIGDTKKLLGKDGLFNLDLPNARLLDGALRDIAGNALDYAETMSTFQGKQYLRSARADLVQMAVDMGMNRRVARDFIRDLLALDQVNAVPTIDVEKRKFDAKADAANSKLHALGNQKVFPEVDLHDKASPKIRHIKSLMDQLKDKTITLTSVYATMKDPRNIASGGYVSGPGTTTSDSIPAMLSNGEFVMRAAAVQHYGIDAMYAMNAKRLASGGRAGFADGGGVGSTYVPSGGPNSTFFTPLQDAMRIWERILRREAHAREKDVEHRPEWWRLVNEELEARRKDIASRLKEAEVRQEIVQKELDTAQQVLDGWRQAMDAIAQTVKSKVGLSHLFGEDATFESILEGIESARALNSQYASAILALKRMGLTEDALAAFLNDASAQQVVDFAHNQSPEQIQQLNDVYSGYLGSEQYLGDVAGIAAFGDREQAAAAEVRALRLESREARQEVKKQTELLEAQNRRIERLEATNTQGHNRTRNSVDKLAGRVANEGSRR